jgi:hypothetical protein
MPGVRRVEIMMPVELYRAIETHVASLDKEEKTALMEHPYYHTKESQYILEEFLLTRRNIPEAFNLDSEVNDSGEIIVTEQKGLLG